MFAQMISFVVSSLVWLFESWKWYLFISNSPHMHTHFIFFSSHSNLDLHLPWLHLHLLLWESWRPCEKHVKTVLKKLFKYIRGNVVLVSWCFLLVPGLILVVVFLFEDIIQIYENEIVHEGKLCNFFSFVAIWTVVSSNGSTCTISYLTYLFCKRGKRGDFKIVVIGNACSWVLGSFFY